MKVKKILKN
uniref:Truncated envelope glycoprotein n=1 Tax=Human immunodeficiency virus type 1 TaxID=11676 RepID=A0A0H3Y9F1_HV1|nr:truncated envelope glycoprotein [Human immunodeficiency virus 1]